MSKVFRRPMFRKGGGVNMNGIMSGIQDREMHAESDPMGVGGQTLTPSERIKEALKKYEEPAFDPVAQLLIQGGLRGLSQTGGGGTLANLALAFQEPTGKFFETAQKRKDVQREIALAGVEADIGADLQTQKLDEEARQALLQREFVAAQGDLDRQNEIRKEIIKGQNKIDELQFMIDNPEADPAKKGVIPSIITQQMDRERSYAESTNLELQKSPDFHARKTVNFERTAPPEILNNYKGIVFYGYGRKGDIEKTLPPGAGKAGDIIYDPQQAGFFIFDNEGNTYRYDPATNTAAE
jgi:hypothetical protein